MLRLLKYVPVVLSIIGVIRKSRKDAAAKQAGTARKAPRKRRSTFRK